jgi:hypothetical protein
MLWQLYVGTFFSHNILYSVKTEHNDPKHRQGVLDKSKNLVLRLSLRAKK